jgi:putative membrane protein
MVRFLVRSAITALGVLGVAYLGLIAIAGIGPGHPFTWGAFWVAFLFAVVLGLVNGTIKPIVQVLSLPITILTLGLFALLVNLGMFYLAAVFFKPTLTLNPSIWLTALAAIIVAIVSGIAGGLTGNDR